VGTRSTVGISAIAQLLPSLDYVDMDGAMLLSKDIASGVTIENGRCVYPEENGNGVTLIPNRKRVPRLSYGIHNCCFISSET